MRTRAGLSSENSDCEVFANQTEDLLLCFLWVMVCIRQQLFVEHQRYGWRSRERPDLNFNYMRYC